MKNSRNFAFLLSVAFIIGGNQAVMALQGQETVSNETAPQTTTDSASTAPASEETFIQSADSKWSKCLLDAQDLLKNGKEMPATSTFKRAVTLIQKSPADETAKQRMTAISNKKLGQCYAQCGDYVKADTHLSLARDAYAKLALPDTELEQLLSDLAQHYKTIEPTTLGESVTGYLKEAGVSKIAVFRQPEKDLVEINLEKKYVKPIESKDVPKVSFNKKVSFEFFNLPNGDYKVQKIQGLQVLAKSLWVNLFESLLKVGDKPVAEVTAGKMGVTKTVTVDVPSDMYTSTKQILDNLISAIKGQPAYAATPAAASSSDSAAPGSNATQTESAEGDTSASSTSAPEQ